jgi:hypothetical protein
MKKIEYKIILFTRITDDKEWNAWVVEMEKSPQNNEIVYKKDNDKLVIKNGRELLGNISLFSKRPDKKNKEVAEKFISNLWKQIKNEKDPTTMIAIHFGEGKTYDGTLRPWLEYFSGKNSKLKKISKEILNNFNKEEKPVLKEYSIGGNDKEWINRFIKNPQKTLKKSN